MFDDLIETLRLLCEGSLAVSVAGLVFVAGGFLALIAINLVEAALGRPLRRPLEGAPIAEADLPHVLVQIPCFNEAETVPGALRAAAALDWPRDRLHIQLLDDSTDRTSLIAARVAAELRAKGIDVAHVRRNNRSGFKAGALAAGLRLDHSPLVAILDVDFRPPSNWLRAAVPTLVADAKAGFVQSRCEFTNYRANWLTRAQGMLLDTHFALEQATRYRAGWLFQFNGTGGIWRREAIEAAGGWSADSLCEDLDLTVRAALAGWHGTFLMDPAIPGLVPERVKHWRVQQRRWSTGFVQVANKLLRPVWTSSWSLGRKVSASFLILIQAFYPSAGVATAALAACFLLRGGDLSPYLPLVHGIATLVLVMAVALTVLPYVMLRRGPLWRYAATIALVPPLLIYVSVSNTPSIIRTLFGRTESFKRTPKSLSMLLGDEGENGLGA